ncbi:Tn7-like transposition protein D [Paraburkholderia caballeronis]|uniref:Tn7-like transposition protein D n=2 Tax=Paraburkholderia caballeronis TaxID=416943 RepID=A0A1H7SH11_9BURK|nr:Tn7-like transposition protein D [Paraburkholderia caballeronis]PXW95955.1 Tn7-like transposition protein D [Paraburkholderia caballeronis]RAJ92321.1 Tn7-like transposition protein D [Paraburkholderia caballeronis]TDV27874.1 Tn7-like transposition protein D [Paraburkholderia caballeronis]SEB52719.1 Tn7-like transposition protein D [Paraburkholderia caballeronis]
MRALTDGRFRTPCPMLDALCQCGNRTELQCPECARIDLSNLGRLANHTAHCIDYVTRCIYHDALLECAGDGSRLEALLIHPNSEPAHRNSARYARLATALATGSQATWSEITRLLTERRYLHESGRWNLGSLRSDFQRFFSSGFEDPRLSSITDNGDYIESAIRKAARGRPIHPTIVVLLAMFGSEVDALPARVRGARQTLSTSTNDWIEVETHRSAWLKTCAQNSGASRTSIRRLAPAAWAWLYRNDQAWLMGNQVPKIRRHGRKKMKVPPAAVECSIASTSKDFRPSKKGIPPLPSAYQTRLAFGMRDHAFARIVERLGGTGAHAQLPGRKRIFVARREAHALSTVGPGARVQAETTVARIANLRPETLRAHSKR